MMKRKAHFEAWENYLIKRRNRAWGAFNGNMKKTKNGSHHKNHAHLKTELIKEPPISPRTPAYEKFKPQIPERQNKISSRTEELPVNYGDNQIYLLVRDPYGIYAYWEIQRDHEERCLFKLGGSWDDVVSILRVYDVTTPEATFYDVTLRNMAKSWYLSIEPDHSYYIEIGLRHKDGRFISLARSNQVRTPRSGMSDVIDEQWMSLDFEKMYALSGGFQAGKSSAELRKLMEERLIHALGSGSGSISNLSSPVRGKERGFHFWLECELIIYGGTAPDARVTMQGKPVQIRPDGTFTLRYGLPDGKFVFNCRAESSDGKEIRRITPVVSRGTDRPAPVHYPENGRQSAQKVIAKAA